MVTKEKAIEILKSLKTYGDYEEQHAKADSVLLALINDEDVTIAFNEIPKWYS